MEAPEKIYVTECMVFMTNPEITLSGDNKIEYTRTDAFIDKACKWLKENIENYYYLDEAYDQVISIKRILEDFPKAMEE